MKTLAAPQKAVVLKKNRSKMNASQKRALQAAHRPPISAGGILTDDPRGAIRAAVEGFAFARETGQLEVSFLPHDRIPGKFRIVIVDTSEASAAIEFEESAGGESPAFRPEASRGVQSEVCEANEEGGLHDAVLEEVAEEDLIRTNEERADILSHPEMCTLSTFAETLNVSTVAVNELLEEGRVIGLRGVSRRHKFPSWQVKRVGLRTEILPGISEMLDVSGGDHWAVYNFLVTSGINTKRPMYFLLETGRKDEVVDYFQKINSRLSQRGCATA